MYLTTISKCVSEMSPFSDFVIFAISLKLLIILPSQSLLFHLVKQPCEQGILRTSWARTILFTTQVVSKDRFISSVNI